MSGLPGPRANYISNLSLDEVSGGWSGFNAAIFGSLSRHFSLSYIGPVSPPPDLVAKAISRLRRSTGRPGSFSFFSRRRLVKVRRTLEALAGRDVNLDFFHGSTPWISYVPEVVYACYLDVSFATYIDVYHDRSEFDQSDLQRIGDQEARWLERAARVFFSSRWAMERCAEEYQLDPRTLHVAGLGAYVPIPIADVFVGGRDFLFMALDFAGKGGHVCVEAFRIVRDECPEARLRIVGAKPPAEVLGIPGVVYEGMLDKAVPAELARMQSILSTGFALIHPTTRDATPQVIIEAQYHGCPVIAPRSFGIPEMVIDNVTGCLVSPPPNAFSVAERMLWLCRNSTEYKFLRAAARSHSIEHFTWSKVGDRIAAELLPIVA